MAPTLEAIRGGGGSVKVGTIGTIGSLMTREIESSSPRTSVPAVRGNGPLKPRKLMSEASSSSSSSSISTPSSIKHKSPEAFRKTKVQNLSTTTPRRPKQKTPFEDVGKNSTVSQGTSKRSLDPSGKTRSRKRSYHIPMLGSENIHLDKTPIRDKPTKKGSTIVDIVDIHCGNPGGSISNRLKKLNFSKLSQSFM
ncbi:uncharacterized protein LOC110720999 [Chenopodium quinoa]|uniref:uncharacterized protein LOC110720999 n=1 Tax=Chenopodium quinoa TaxID=63459 RepID=UPI000B770A89|nr:uncharacterized protein LOC110720999 [Chenopodium quinoa]XP_021755813.1 uncharacterized protein LOC110720999 [Chenopodium quinoa]